MGTGDRVKALLARAIMWKKAGPTRWEAKLEDTGERCSLQMNDFPEEPLYTVSTAGESLDLDDAPPHWLIERD